MRFKTDHLLFIGLISLFLSGGSLFYLRYGGLFFYSVLIVCASVYALLNNTKITAKNVYRTGTTCCIVLLIIFLRFILDLIINSYFSITPIKLMYRVISITIFIIIYNESQRSIISDLIKILKITAIYSLLNFIVINTFNFNAETVQYGFVTPHNPLYLFYYLSQIVVKHTIIYRNMGFFWEPGVLAVHMNILLFLSLYHKKNKFGIIISTLTIFTTFSTMGLIVLILNYIPIFINYLKKKPLLIPFIIILSIYPAKFIADNIHHKFVNNKGSTISRFSDINTSIFIINQNPILGIGFNELKFEEYRNQLLSAQEKNITVGHSGNSNGFADIFVKYGLIFTFVFIAFFYRFARLFNKKNLLFLVCILNLNAEPLFLSGVFLLFIFLQKEDIQESVT